MNNDLISREALKKALKSNCDLCLNKNTNWCEHCCPLNDFEDLIDNAPAVEAVPLEHHNKIKGFLDNEVKSLVDILDNERPKGEVEITNEDIQQAIKEGFSNGYEMAKAKFSPKQGEWITDNLHNTICDNCGGIRRDNRVEHIAFCNKCGAKMKGGVE